jgi:carbamoyl-phosphate synthase large subunit
MIKVLVSGVGAVIGYGIIASLRAMQEQVFILGIDLDSEAVGKHWCDAFVACPRLDAPNYKEFLVGLVQAHQIDLMIPGLPQEIDFLAAPFMKDEIPTTLALNQIEFIQLAQDKLALHEQLAAEGLPNIPTMEVGTWREMAQALGTPFLLKPRRGMSSRGIHRIENETDLNYWKNKGGSEGIAQRIMGDVADEFTVGVFGFGDGTSTVPITFKRRLAPGGATGRAEVVSIPQLDSLVERLTQLWKPLGPTNFQFRYHAGNYWLHDVNPRISSSSSIRAAFGFNEPQMCVEFFLRGTRPAPEIKFGKATRYLVERVEYADGGVEQSHGRIK